MSRAIISEVGTLSLGFRIDEDLFGDIYTTFTSVSNFCQESFEYGVGAIRWPGGSLAEGRNGGGISYELMSSDLYENPYNINHNRGFSDILQLSTEGSRDLSIILPTFSIFEAGRHSSPTQRDAILADHVQELDVFLDRLSRDDGYYDEAIDFFQEGNTLTLEIGNETAHLGWSNGVYDFGWNYGTIVTNALQWANENSSALNALGIEMAVQMGTNLGGAHRIIQELSEAADDGFANVFSSIDSLVSHNALVFAASDFDFSHERSIIDTWSDAVEDRIDENQNIELYASAWSVGDHRFGSSIIDGDLTLADSSDFNAQRFAVYLDFLDDLDGNDIGARQAAGTLDVFAKLVALGYESSALWGTVDPALHTNSLQSSWSSGRWNGSSEENDFDLSHGGEVLRLLASNLVGMQLASGGAIDEDPAGNIFWNATYFESASGRGAGEVNSFFFTGNQENAIVSSVTDIDGYLSTSTGSLTAFYDISDFPPVEIILVEAVTTEFNFAAWQEFRDNPDNSWYLDGLSHRELTDFRRFFEVPVISEFEIEVGNQTTFEYEFTSDFETVFFTLPSSFENLSETQSSFVICWPAPSEEASGSNSSKMTLEESQGSIINTAMLQGLSDFQEGFLSIVDIRIPIDTFQIDAKCHEVFEAKEFYLAECDDFMYGQTRLGSEANGALLTSYSELALDGCFL